MVAPGCSIRVISSHHCPAVPPRLAHETGLLPGPATDAHLDASYRGRPGPGHPSNRDVAAVDFFARARLRDQGAHPLQRHRLPQHPPLALPLVEVRIGLEQAAERVTNLEPVRNPEAGCIPRSTPGRMPGPWSGATRA